jgi:hypothetical protein
MFLNADTTMRAKLLRKLFVLSVTVLAITPDAH